MKVMLVDDSKTMRTIQRNILMQLGYKEIEEACDGQDALTKLDGRKIHLIVSDVNMPRMDGIAFLTAVKAHPNYKFTPVIMLTTEADESKKAAGKAAGAGAWVVKPFQPPILLDTIAKLVLP